jgi:hypothetical protein
MKTPHDPSHRGELVRPWRRSPRTRSDFTAERRRCLQLVDEVASRELHSDWPDHPVFGRMTGEQVSRLHAKHLNHHLTQFGV